MQNKTILQVLPSLVSGGVEKGTVEVSLRLKQELCNPLVASAGGSLVRILQENGIKHFRMPLTNRDPLSILYNAKTLAKYIKEKNIDIIHARSRAPAWSAYLASKLTGIKFVTTFHGIYNISNIFKKHYSSVMVKGEKIVAVSNFVKQYILKNYPVKEENIEVIYRGVDYNIFDPNLITKEKIIKLKEKYNVPANNLLILLPARMTEWKGHMILIEALKKIKNLNFYCLMVGDLSKHPEFVKRVRNKIMEYKLQNKIQIFGHESNMFDLYAISDIVVSPSIRPEAFGRTIIEAQAMEKLIIATNIGGAAETIKDNFSGYHVAENDAEKLSTKIAESISNFESDAILQIRKQARDSVIEHFSLEKMLQKTLAIYSKLLDD